MSKAKFDINEILLEAHKRGLERALEASIRTGVPLAISINGEIVEIKPKYKYVRVPIIANKKKKQLRAKS